MHNGWGKLVSGPRRIILAAKNITLNAVCNALLITFGCLVKISVLVFNRDEVPRDQSIVSAAIGHTEFSAFENKHKNIFYDDCRTIDTTSCGRFRFLLTEHIMWSSDEITEVLPYVSETSSTIIRMIKIQSLKILFISKRQSAPT